MGLNFLTFSDAAKYALVAKNLLSGLGFSTTFSFWGNTLFSTSGISFVPPYLISLFMEIFGVGDKPVLYFSMFSYLLLIISIYLLGKKIFGKLVGVLSALAIAANVNYIDYATSGATEPIFAFEIVFGMYLISLKKKWATLISLFVLVAMYFTRPQAFIYVAGLLMYWLISRFGIKKGSLYFVSMGMAGFIIDKFVILPLSSKYPLTSIFVRGMQAIFTYSSSTAVSDSLRGAAGSTLGISEVAKKVFYNLYNFYKALPDIANPYLWGMFFIGLFHRSKEKLNDSFKLSVLFMLLMTLLVTALSIPFYRYIHPIIPLVYLVAVETLVFVITKIFNNKKIIILVSSILILILCIGQTLGVLLLDSRFEAKTHNVGKAPVYVELSKILKNNTDVDQIVVTNLDTWGSWYGERKTVWFPLETKMLIDEKTGQIPFDAIYLTSYKMDDDNYRMGEGWRLIFNNPESPSKWTCDGCAEIAKEFILKDVYKVSAADNYERENATGVLLIKK